MGHNKKGRRFDPIQPIQDKQLNIQNLGLQKNNGNKIKTNGDCDNYEVKIFN